MIQGLSHMTFVVRDLDRTARILIELLDAKEVYSSGAETFSVAPEKFFLVGDLWIAIMEGEPLATTSYNHVAFKIDDAEFDDYRRRVETLGLRMLPPRPRVPGEGRSLYFYDDDNHLFELHTGTLSERLARYAAGKQAAE
ncbi:FosX/FosE/FosI family fosfomycin resistance hydrolase [Shinella pollutisoli]|uniref:FosX/FosE/FosI family fosfomycin resistance hydrolase n=1 Tax=Shinella pollutisoli TaxID=2250594 RepID=A0ABV7DL64_9HYPH|nr:FosX/FosE/FosI family fosfomycin resistance hydrolase [Shinella pollutisoli]